MTKDTQPIKLQEIKAILIDFDGTIVDSLPALYKVYLQFLEAYGIKGTEQEFHSLIGPTIPEIVRRITEHHQIQEPTLELIDHYNELLDILYARDVKMFSGVKECLIWMKEQGIELCVVSSASERIVKRFLDANELLPYFSAVVTAEQVSQGKPHPEIYQKAIQVLKIAPNEAIALEDSIHGVCSATNAGIFTLGIHGVYHLFDYTFKNWNDLLTFLKSSQQYETELSDTKNFQ